MAKYIPTIQATLDTYLQWRLIQQQLANPGFPVSPTAAGSKSAEDVLRTVKRCGWLPEPRDMAQLALLARGYEAPEIVLGEQRQAGGLVAVRTVRGMRALVERESAHFAVAAGRDQMSRRWKPVWKTFGIEPAEKEKALDRVMSELDGEAKKLTADELAAGLPEKWLNVHPAAVWKKAGGNRRAIDLLLAEMDEAGRVYLEDGKYELFSRKFPELPAPGDVDLEEARLYTIEKFFEWGNVANPEDVAWWGGWPTKLIENILYSGDLPLNNLVLPGSNSRGYMIHGRYAEVLKATQPERESPVWFLPARDTFFGHMPRFLARILTEEHQATVFGKSALPGALAIERGRAIAVWHFADEELTWTSIVRMNPALRKRLTAGARKTTEWLQKQVV